MELLDDHLGSLLCGFFALLIVAWAFFSDKWAREQAREQAKRNRETLPARCLTLLLKYVALGDRRLGDGEKLHIKRVVEGSFPGLLSEAELLGFVENLNPEYHALSDYAIPFRGLSEEGRRNLLGLIASVGEADGKTTKSERERLEAVQAALGL